ncbi:MAG: hypothetical protein P8X90_29100 [Desulfobacterales bacterium]|jgi:hypothetical protein
MQLYRQLQKAGVIVALVLVSDPAFATQAHGAPEGLYAHQLAHIFFIVSMGVLIYWLRERKLVRAVGWRYIQYAAFFFILWNLDAFSVHLLEEQIAVINVRHIDPWKISITASNQSSALTWVYYAAKLDHLLCVPALLFLYFGLRRLLKDTATSTPGVSHS